MYLTPRRTTEFRASPERPGPFLIPPSALYFPVSVVYLPSPKWRTIHALSAVVYAGLFLVGLSGKQPVHPLFTLAGIVGFMVHARRAALHGQQIELTSTALICRTRFSEQRLPYTKSAACVSLPSAATSSSNGPGYGSGFPAASPTATRSAAPCPSPSGPIAAATFRPT